MRRALLALLAISTPARADVPMDACSCSPNKPGFHRASALTGDWNHLRYDMAEKGVRITPTYAGELFAAPGLSDDKVVTAGLFALNVDVDFATLVHDHLPALHLSGFGIHGHGLSERLMDVYGVSNNVAQPGVRMFEAYVEQPIGEHIGIRAGLIAADQEFVLADHSTVLLNATFGILAMVSYDIGNPVYPVATPGVSAHYEREDVTFRAALYDGDQHNEHGIPSRIGNEAFVIGEVDLLGTYKAGVWHHTALGNGYFGIVDKQLDGHVGAFARVSLAPHAQMPFYADTGIRIGPGPLRPRDFMSLGLACARTPVGTQTAVEASYQYLVKGWLTVQPDLQLLLTREHPSAVIGAVRVVVAL